MGVELHSDHQHAELTLRPRRIPCQATPFLPSSSPSGQARSRRALFALAPLVPVGLVLAGLVLAGCGSTYRPVVSAVNPVGPAAQPQKFAVAIANTSPPAPATPTPGLVSIVDFSGDTLLITASIGANPQYLQLDAGGDTAYTLNGDGTTNSFGVSTQLLTSSVNQTTLPANAAPVAILPQGSNLYIAEAGRNAIAQLTQSSPPAFRQELNTGSGTVYTVGVANAPRVYAISQGAAGALGAVSAIETTSNTVSSTIPVGRGPIYGVMTADGRRAFILNKTDGTISVINAQSNALDTFTSPSSGAVTSTIPAGVGPVWADFAPTLTEMLVANQGNGITPGSVTVVSIPLCTSNTVVTNPNCNPANPLDAVGFGQVVANIPVGINPIMIAVLQDGSQAFVANQGNASNPGSISVINLTTDTVVATVPAGFSANPLDNLVHGHPSYIAATSGTPTGKVYVTATDSTDLTIIRTDTDTVQTHIPLQGTGIAVRVTQP